MAPWLLALIFVVVLGGIGWFVDHRARRARRGLDPLNTQRSGSADPIANVESIRPGSTSEALGQANANWNSTGL
jgi:hypothetical protein